MQANRLSRSDLAAAVAVAAGSLGLLLSFTPWRRPVVLDPATWDYMSVSLSGGLLPYRDIFLHKTPGGALLGAAGATFGAYVGLTPIQGAHALYWILGALGPALLFLLLRPRAPRSIAFAAAAFMLAFDAWPVAAIEGVRPKVATTVFGLAALLCGGRSAWSWAGAFGGAATLCWQPGVAFLVGAAWQMRGLRGQALKTAAARLVFGAAVPTTALLLWLASVGALVPFFEQAVGFNFHYIRLHARTPIGTLRDILTTLLDWSAVEIALLPLAGIGMQRSSDYLEPGIAATGLAYLAMSFVSFQAWPDTILFAAPVAALLAAGLGGLTVGLRHARTARGALVAVAVAAALCPVSGRLKTPITYQEQAAFMHGLETGLAPDDRVLVVSLPEFLIHTGRRSVWMWPYLWFGVDHFADAHTPGGFDRLLADLEADPPPLMLVARRWSGPLRQRFDRWAAGHYTRERIRFYPHTVRPINVYRLRRSTVRSNDLRR